MFGIVDSVGQSWLTQLRTGLSPLKVHKFNHHFDDTNNPMCLANDGIEDNEHFLLHCRLFNSIRNDLFHNVSLLLQKNFSNIDNTEAVKILLYGNKYSNTSTNNKILTQTINFIRRSNHFSKTSASPFLSST